MITTLCVILVIVQTKLAMVPAEMITATIIDDLTKGLAELLPIIKSIKSNGPSYNRIDNRHFPKHTTKWKEAIKQKSNVPSGGNIEMINIINPKNGETISYEKTIVVSKYPGSNSKWGNKLNAINGESKKHFTETKGYYPLYGSNYDVPRRYDAGGRYYGSLENKYKPMKTIELVDDHFKFNDDDNARDFSNMKNDINDNTETSAEKLGWDIFDQNSTTDIKSNFNDTFLFDEKRDDIKDWHFPREKNHPPVDTSTVEYDDALLEIFTGLVLKHSANETSNATVSNLITANQTTEITS